MDRLRCHSVWLIVLVGLALPGVGWSNVSVPEGYRTIAMEHDIPHTVLYAVALTESATRIDQGDLYRPWPWTLNVAGRGYFFDTRLAAWQALKNWLREGQVSIDIGLLRSTGDITRNGLVHRGRHLIRITTCVWARPSCKRATRPDRIGGPAWVVITRRRTQIGQIATVNG